MMCLPSMDSHPGGKISAICGRYLERLRSLAKKYKIEEVFTDYREMLDKGYLDAVIVASPDDLHFPMAMSALDAGFHVLCEKPLATNTQEVHELLDKTKQDGVVHMVLFTWRWMPDYRYLHVLISGGYIGEYYQCYMSFIVSSCWDTQEYKWQYDAKISRGVISGLGSHMFDLCGRFLGDVSRVNAQFSTFADTRTHDAEISQINDVASVMLEFTNQTQGVLQVSGMIFLGESQFEQRIFLYGSHGTLEVEMNFDGKAQGIRLKDGRVTDGDINILPIPNHFTKAIYSNNLMKPFISQSAGPRVFIDACIESERCRTLIPIC